MRALDGLIDPPMSRRLDLARLSRADVGVGWIGHATMLIRLAGRWILTDPVWSSRVGLGLGPLTLGPRRLQQPALSMSRLPPIDVVLLSHAHFDHFDLPTLHRLAAWQRPVVITAAGTGDLLRGLSFKRVIELEHAHAVDVAGLRVTSHPVNHWTARAFSDTWRSASAYVIESAGQRLLFGGDTAMFDGFDNVGPVDLAMLGIGAYNPFRASHATPEEAWTMATRMRAERVAAMHHATFRLSLEPVDEPLRRLIDVAGPEADRVVIRRPGDVAFWSGGLLSGKKTCRSP
ncbi:MAG: MBL fold metallo-hydrolase [Planctomycetota bacterium]